MPGGSLFDHLHKRSTKFNDSQIINMALEMAIGMNYLHANHMLHCDLKSSNILVSHY